MIIMKNFNRCSMVTMGQSATNWRNTHTHMDRTHSTTWCEVSAQLLLFSACWIFSCFRNPPNSDMDYRIFTVRTWSFLRMHIHTGVGHTDSESAQHFWLGKTHKFFLCSWLDSNLGPLNLESDALPTEPPRHPENQSKINIQSSHKYSIWTFIIKLTP